MADVSLVGQEYWSATVLVEAGAILRFAESVGEDTRRRAGAPLEAPASFLHALLPFDALANVLGESARQIHASEFQVDQLRPVTAGQRLELRSRIVDVVRRAGASGATDIVSVDDEGRDSTTGEVVFRDRRVFAVIGAKEAA